MISGDDACRLMPNSPENVKARQDFFVEKILAAINECVIAAAKDGERCTGYVIELQSETVRSRVLDELRSLGYITYTNEVFSGLAITVRW